MIHVAAILLVNLLTAVGCAAVSAWMFQQRKVKQAEAIAFHQKIASSRWLKFVPIVWLHYRFGPDPASRKWEVDYLIGVAFTALFSLALFAIFILNLIHLIKGA